MSWLLLLLFVIVLSAISLWIYGRAPYKSLAHIPGPPASLLLGNLSDFKDKLYFHVHDEYAKRYGPVSKHYMGRQGVVMVTDPVLIKDFMVSSFDDYHNRPVEGSRRIRTTTSLLFARDEYWRRLRRTMSPTFNAAQMKNMIPHIEEQVQVFESKLDKAADSSASVNIHALIGRLTLDIIGSVAFGTNLNVQNDQESEIVKAANGVLRNSLAARGIDGLSRLMTTVFPFLGPLFVKLFPSKAEKELLEDVVKMDTCSDVLLKKRRKELDEEGEERKTKKDFLDLVINAKDPETGVGLSDREILDQSNLFLLAGHETTANAIAYTIYLLAQHPEIDEELSRECKEFEEVSYKTLRDMKLMNMVIKESLRLYPPVVVLRREADKDTELGGYHIPKGTFVMAPIWSLHYDESYWKDATAFKPVERWSDESNKDHPYHWLPFGTGPHGCIGARFALMEAALVLALILKKFRFSLEPGQVPLQFRAGITIVPSDGIHVKVYRREE